jgi:hypothetical protein
MMYHSKGFTFFQIQVAILYFVCSYKWKGLEFTIQEGEFKSLENELLNLIQRG